MAKQGGQTAMKHARAWLALEYPDAPTMEAQKAVAWIKDKQTQETRPISRREDLFGVFDLLALDPSRGTVLVQVTTYHAKGSAASERRAKIALWCREHFPKGPAFPMTVMVIAWERAKGFRTWTWDWSSRTWERGWATSPLLARRSAATRRQPELPTRRERVLAARGFQPAP